MGRGDSERMGGPHPDPDGVETGPWDEPARRNVDGEAGIAPQRHCRACGLVPAEAEC